MTIFGFRVHLTPSLCRWRPVSFILQPESFMKSVQHQSIGDLPRIFVSTPLNLKIELQKNDF